MKRILFGFILVSSSALAQIPNFDIQNFNFIFNNPAGTGTASSFTYKNAFKDDEALRVDVEKIVQDFKVVISGSETREILVKNAPKFVQEAQSIELINLNANSSTAVALSLTYGKFVSVDNALELKDFFLNCDKASGNQETVFIQGCINKMTLKASQYKSDAKMSSLNPVDAMGLALVNVAKSSDLTINDIDLKIVNGKLDLSAEIKAQISGKAKGNGNVSYDQNTKKLTIKISEVKFGFLNVTNQVFAELKKQEGEQLKVSKPYVYYSLR
jgi:hypothetical protein